MSYVLSRVRRKTKIASTWFSGKPLTYLELLIPAYPIDECFDCMCMSPRIFYAFSPSTTFNTFFIFISNNFDQGIFHRLMCEYLKLMNCMAAENLSCNLLVVFTPHRNKYFQRTNTWSIFPSLPCKKVNATQLFSFHAYTHTLSSITLTIYFLPRKALKYFPWNSCMRGIWTVKSD